MVSKKGARIQARCIIIPIAWIDARFLTAQVENYEQGYHDFKIGVMIREARNQAGLTQKQLADHMQVKPPLISRLENNAGDVKLSTLHKIASSLNLQLNINIGLSAAS